jgi:glucose-6-phosphate isomerase
MALDVTARRGRLQHSLHISAGSLNDVFHSRAQAAERAAGGLYRREPGAWTPDPDVAVRIANRLGWLSSPELMMTSLPRLRQFAGSVKSDGFTDVVLLGMGGSSLAPEVLRASLGTAAGFPRLHMLDSTDPAAVRAAATPEKTTLYILASKSGTTVEPNSLAAHFADRLRSTGVKAWGRQFVAITDGGTDLERRARESAFRETFINPSDIGGRYSALSYFGLVPAALMGQDIESLVEWGVAMLAAAEPGFGEALSNPAVGLGVAIGAGAQAGRDKMTLFVPDGFEALGLWVEQLIAESTGKNGVGVIPITGEPAGDADVYGSDRLFVRLRSAKERDASEERMRRNALAERLSTRDVPIVDLDLAEPSALGAEFVRWEIATAVAGALLHINPFDEPNVQQAKDATRVLLDGYKSTGSLPIVAPDATLPNGITLRLSSAARRYVTGGPDQLLSVVREGDYVALLAYVGPDAAVGRELHELRRVIRDRTRAATMFGYGPRYLHSTGQLHKGGPNTGVFVLITASPDQDVPIPGEPFSFGILERAQALGDFQSLEAAGRRALHVHLPSPEASLVRELRRALLGDREK